jgi:hypothetical protein
MMIHFLPSTHALKDFEEALRSKVRAQRKMYSTYHDGCQGNYASFPIRRCWVGPELVLHEKPPLRPPIFISWTRCLFQVSLAYQREYEQCLLLYQLIRLKLWTQAKLDPSKHCTNHHPPKLSCAYRPNRPYQCPDRLHPNNNPHPLV